MLAQIPDLIIWDWDGTLVDSLPVIYDAHNTVRKQMGYEGWSLPTFLRDIIVHSTDQIYPKLYGDRFDEAKRKLDQYFDDRFDPKDTVFLPGSRETVTFLSGLNIPMMVVSNKRHFVLVQEVAVSPFSDCFISCVGAEKAQRDKPYPDPVFLALEEADIDPDSVKNSWFIGDTQTDIDCAKGLSFPVRSVIIGEGNAQGCDIRFDDLPSFLMHIKSALTV